MLRNPYYFGVVPYRGVYHEGKHEPLISAELWLRVQDVLYRTQHFRREGPQAPALPEGVDLLRRLRCAPDLLPQPWPRR